MAVSSHLENSITLCYTPKHFGEYSDRKVQQLLPKSWFTAAVRMSVGDDSGESFFLLGIVQGPRGP